MGNTTEKYPGWEYQQLFDLMADHGLDLLQGEMDEIIECVNLNHKNKILTNKILSYRQALNAISLCKNVKLSQNIAKQVLAINK